MAKKKQSTPLSVEALAALRSAVFADNAFTLTDEKLACYDEIKAIVAALGGKWVSRAKQHQFSAGVDARSLVIAACDQGVIPATNPNDFFPTPSAVVDAMLTEDWMRDRVQGKIESARIDGRALRFLEPHGGSGALVNALVGIMRPGDELVIVELNPLLAAGLRQRFPQATVIECDFLSYGSDSKFDVILMNPPFAGKTYIKHVRRAFGMLATYGVLATVVPTGFEDHGDDFLYLCAEAGQWTHLGADRFEGTSVGTSIIWMENDPSTKWREKPHDGYSTHHAWDLCVSIGSDGDMLKRLAKSTGFEDAVRELAGYASAQLRDCHAVRVDKSIAEQTLASLVSDYGHSELAHVLPQPKPGQLELLSVAA